MIRDVLAFGVVNRALMLSVSVLTLLLLGLLMIAAKASAPFIYKLF
jgi:hypothetical protein